MKERRGDATAIDLTPLDGVRIMVQRALVRRRVTSSATTATSPRRPHYLDHQGPPKQPTSYDQVTPVKIHTDDWMHVELLRGDYILAALVAVLVALAVSVVTLVPAIVFFNWLSLASVSLWARLIVAVPLCCGMVGAWSCLRRAKSDRIRARLLDELRN